jgi:hypothetical protein
VLGLTVTAVPLVAAMFPGVITPVPPLNTPVKLELDPASIVVGFAAKLVIEGGMVVVVEPLLPQPVNSKTATPAMSAATKKFRFTIDLDKANRNLEITRPGDRALPGREATPSKPTLLAKFLWSVKGNSFGLSRADGARSGFWQASPPWGQLQVRQPPVMPALFESRKPKASRI